MISDEMMLPCMIMLLNAISLTFCFYPGVRCS